MEFYWFSRLWPRSRREALQCLRIKVGGSAQTLHIQWSLSLKAVDLTVDSRFYRVCSFFTCSEGWSGGLRVLLQERLPFPRVFFEMPSAPLPHCCIASGGPGSCCYQDAQFDSALFVLQCHLKSLVWSPLKGLCSRLYTVRNPACRGISLASVFM